jgi:hypothetical protein
VPAALRAHTILEPQGDSPAEIATAIDRLRGEQRKRHLTIGAGAALIVALAAGGYTAVRWSATPSSPPGATAPSSQQGANAPSAQAAAAAGTNTAGAAAAPPSTTAEPRDPVEAYNDALIQRTPADRRVTLTAMPGNSGWTAVLTLVDLSASEVSYSLDGGSTFTDTGSSGIINTMTGRPRPNTAIHIPGEFWRRRELSVKYTDGKGVDHGPYQVELNPRAEFLRFTKQAMAAIEWVSVSQPSPGQRLAYFTSLVSYKAAFKEIRYSFDSAALNAVWPLKVDPSEGWPPEFSDEQLYLAVPPAAKFITVKVVYVDGSVDTRRVDIATR